MNRIKSLFAALVLAATVAVVPAAHAAPQVHYIGVGSSAMFQGFLVAAVNDLAAPPAGGSTHHWSVKTSKATGCGTGGYTCAGLQDTRSGAIPIEYGNLWVAWTTNSSGVAVDVWAYLSVDSTVGVRGFLARPIAKLLLAGNIGSTTPDNAVSPGLLQFGAPGNGATATCAGGFSTNCDDTTLPADVIGALGGTTGKAVTAGMTDIRPEDAKYATLRTLTTHASEDTGGIACTAPCRSFSLGYGPGPVGSSIKSGTGTSTAKATPVNFGLPGQKDPILTNNVVPTSITVYPVGESPIVFLTNRTNTTDGLGRLFTAGDLSYAVRNVWDQHPYPPNGAPPSNTAPPAGANTRRPLGNLFTGHDCATENAAFSWPSDAGQIINPSTGAPPAIAGKVGIHVLLREPLSGTMNTVEFSEFRRYGTTNGNGPTGNGQPALTSQEQLVDSVTNNPLKNKPCVGGAAGFGDRTRAIGTGEMVGGAGNAGGIRFTPDSIGYAFFSFGNVSSIANSKNYGYLMINGIDPLFNEYNNSTGNPGQPAVPGDPTTWGMLPICDAAGVTAVSCTANAIWTGGNSFPHLRDGSYPAWSELRLICDSNDFDCDADTKGALALVVAAQNDVHNSVLGGVPDFLPFSSSNAFGAGNGYGDVNFIRQHYAFQLSTGNANVAPTTTHQSAPAVDFHLEGCSAATGLGVAKTSPPTAECGGDAGGLIVPINSTATGLLQ